MTFRLPVPRAFVDAFDAPLDPDGLLAGDRPLPQTTADRLFETNMVAFRFEVPSWMLEDATYGPPTLAEHEAQVAAQLEARRALAAAWDLYDAATTRLADLDGLAGAVARLHMPLDPGDPNPRCGGCDGDGYDREAPYWPCRTVGAVADALDPPQPLPDQHDLYAARPEGPTP